MSGGLVITKSPLPEGSVAHLRARVVGGDDAVITVGDLYDNELGTIGPNFTTPALNAWCVNVYDLSSDTPNRNLFVDRQTISWGGEQTGTFEVGEIVTMTVTGGTASGTVYSVSNGDATSSGSMTVTDQTGDRVFLVVNNNTLTGATSGATVDFGGTMIGSPSSAYTVPRCGNPDASGSDSGDEDVISVYNLLPIVTLANDGTWDEDQTGFNFSFDLHPAWIEDTDEEGNTLTGWRGGHVYRAEFTLALGSSTAQGVSTAPSGGSLPVVFEFPVEPTNSESAL